MPEFETSDPLTRLHLGNNRSIGRLIAAACLLTVAGFAAYAVVPPSSFKPWAVGVAGLMSAAWLYAEWNFVCYVTMLIDPARGSVCIRRRFIGRVLEDRLAVEDIAAITVVAPGSVLDERTGKTRAGPHPGLELALKDGRSIILVLSSSYTPLTRGLLDDFALRANEAIADAVWHVSSHATADAARPEVTAGAATWRLAAKQTARI